MQSQTQSIHPHPSTSNRARVTAFSEAFLGKLRLLAQQAEEDICPASPGTEAVLSGPFAVKEVARPDGARFAVARSDEPMAEGGRAAAVHRRRDEALRLAAVLPSVAAPPLHHLSDRPKPSHGCYNLHCSRRFVAHLSRGFGRLSPEERRRLTAHLDLVHYLAANPHALALVLESTGPEALPILGRTLARRIEASLP